MSKKQPPRPQLHRRRGTRNWCSFVFYSTLFSISDIFPCNLIKSRSSIFGVSLYSNGYKSKNWVLTFVYKKKYEIRTRFTTPFHPVKFVSCSYIATETNRLVLVLTACRINGHRIPRQADHRIAYRLWLLVCEEILNIDICNNLRDNTIDLTSR